MYDFEKYIKPVWEGNMVIDESFMPIEKEDGSIDPIPLLYKAEKIISVKNSKHTITYQEGADYILKDGKLEILKDGNIEKVKYKDYYLDENVPGGCFPRTGGGFIYFGEADAMHKLQYVVTYIHGEIWQGPLPPYQGVNLPITISKLKNKEPLRIVVYGDSITTGANSSKVINQMPHIDDWCTMTVKALKKAYASDHIESINTAVGGTVSSWGAEHAYDRAAKFKPDLVFIAFGMNDGSGRVSKDDYLRHIKTIMDTVWEVNPDCEFVLVATMLANGEVANFLGNQEEYLPALNTLKGNMVAIADMTTMHKYLLKRKRYYDMSGNNVNHPNDFLARIYAQVMAATLIESRL
jgi:lysophospholipase L1-like esterase